MTSDEALAFLQKHQPMPRDADLDDADAAQYVEIITHFLENPDPRAIPLLINSIPEDTERGMYDSIRFVLMEFPLHYLLPHMQDALLPGSPAIQSRCCAWAADLGAWELEPVIRFAGKSENPAVRSASAAFMSAFEKRPPAEPQQ